MSSWEEGVSWTRDALLVRESAPDLAGKVLESEKGGTELDDSAIEGQSLLKSGLRQARGKEVIERSNPRSTHEDCWEAG